jgi:predicted AAA+ superfamily ATPase
MSEEETQKREIKGLLNACKNFNLTDGLIVTYENEDEIVQDGITISLIPFYKWVFSKKSLKHIFHGNN